MMILKGKMGAAGENVGVHAGGVGNPLVLVEIWTVGGGVLKSISGD